MAAAPADGGGRPRVLLVTPAYPPAVGGIQLLCARLAEHLPGFDVTVVAPPAAGGAAVPTRAAAPNGATPAAPGAAPPARRPAAARLLPAGPVRTGGLNAYAAAVARTLRPDLVLSMHIATAPAAWAAGVPYVQYVYASELPPRPQLAARALLRAARVVAISEHSRALALAHGAREDQLVTIVPGVDQPAPPVATDTPRQPGRLLMVSRMDEPYKGHDTLIRALPLVRAVVPHLHARLLGDGRLRPGLERLAAAVGAVESLTFLGEVATDERDAELRTAAVVCLPSRVPPDGGGEGFGIALLEAGAVGVPVVAGGCGGVRDAVLDGQTGLLIDDPSDHVELAAALTRLLTDEELARRLGAAGRKRTADFTWERMAGAVADVCAEVIGAGRRRA